MLPKDPNLIKLSQQLITADGDIEECDAIWKSIKSPLIKKQDNDQYQVTFLYRCQNKNEVVTLDCRDLRERLLNPDESPRSFIQVPNSNTDLRYLQLDNNPANTFLPYDIEVNGISKKDPLNPGRTFQLSQYNPANNMTMQFDRLSSLLILPEATSDPVWKHMSAKADLHTQRNRIIEHHTYKDESGIFGERDIWLYKPNNFDATKNPKVLFVLDGDAYIKYLPLYLDYTRSREEGTDAAFANTAVVFISNVRTNSVPNRYIPLADEFSVL